MTNHKARLSKLEAKHAPKETIFYLMIYGDDRRVQYGSPELIGMTEAEVTAYLGEDCIRKTIGVDIREI